MSAFQLPATEIANIVGSFVRVAPAMLPSTESATLLGFAEMLAFVNAASVGHFYKQNVSPVVITSAMISAARLNPMGATELVDALKSYRYQSCERPDFNGSNVATAIDGMIAYVASLPAVAVEAAAKHEAERAAQEGSKYRATESETTAQIAAHIRADIKAATKAGTLPRAKYSVKSRTFAGGSAIDVRADDLPFGCYEPGQRGSGFARNWHPVLTTEAAAVKATLDAIHSSYGYDRSDLQSDYFNVRYYGDAEIGETEERNAVYSYCEMLNDGDLNRAVAAE